MIAQILVTRPSPDVYTPQRAQARGPRRPAGPRPGPGYAAGSSTNGAAGHHGPPSSDLRHGRIARYQGSFSPVSDLMISSPALPRGFLSPCLIAADPAR